MIDPFTAFAAAQAMVKGIQAAIKLGKDVQGIAADLGKFFEAKDVVQQAAKAAAGGAGFAGGNYGAGGGGGSAQAGAAGAGSSGVVFFEY